MDSIHPLAGDDAVLLFRMKEREFFAPSSIENEKVNIILDPATGWILNADGSAAEFYGHYLGCHSFTGIKQGKRWSPRYRPFCRE